MYLYKKYDVSGIRWIQNCGFKDRLLYKALILTPGRTLLIKIKIMENNKNKNNNLLSIVPSLVAPTTYIARGQQSSLNFYQELTLVNNCLNRFNSGK